MWDAGTADCVKTHHCEERSDEAIQENVEFAGVLDCFAYARNDEMGSWHSLPVLSSCS